MAERARIATYFSPLAADEPGSFSLNDDAAVLTPPAGKQLVITTDSVIETIHVLAGATPQQFAQKLVRRNVSDLAAMGATPWRYTLNLHTPRDLPDAWFAAFSAALQAEQEQFGMVLVGGDSTSGAVHIHATMTCFGLLDAAALRRNGAQVGDDVYVSGTLGDAACALQLLQQGAHVDAALAARYHAPTPRLALGAMLQDVASAAIDISDGLLADLAQIANASGVGSIIECGALPLSAALKNAAGEKAYNCALSGGDDYELCFTAAPAQRARIAEIAAAVQVPLTRIGSITAGVDVQVMDANGMPLLLSSTGWEHA